MNEVCDISVIVPVFRGEPTLEELLERISGVLSPREARFEVIFVHDGGTKASWQAVQQLHSRYPGTVRAFRLARNYGQNAATLCGLSAARGAQVITIDEDLQTPPEEIGKLLDCAAGTSLELVYGIPEKSRQSTLRRWGSTLMKNFFLRIEGIDIGSSFRLISGKLIDRIKEPRSEHLFINQIINWYTDEIGYVKVKSEPRSSGKSGYTFSELAGISLRLLLFYSDFPLRLMVYLGLFTSATCLFIGVYFLYLKFTAGAVLGFTSLIVAIFFSTGLIISCLSVIGLYIQRIFKNQMGRPVYAIEEELP